MFVWRNPPAPSGHMGDEEADQPPGAADTANNPSGRKDKIKIYNN